MYDEARTIIAVAFKSIFDKIKVKLLEDKNNKLFVNVTNNSLSIARIDIPENNISVVRFTHLKD